MGRRTSGQSVGLEKIGNVQANANTLTTTQTNSDLVLDPNGTGGVVISGDVTIADQGDLRLREGTAGGTNYIAMQASATMAGNYTITWPAAVAGSNGFVLSSDTSGNLSWTNPSNLAIAVSDPGSVATVHYPIFATNAGSLPTSLTPNARSNITFVPSTGELFSDIGRHPNIIGSTANSGTLTIRGTSSSTKATASVLMTDNVSSSSTTTGTLVVTGGVGVSGSLFCNALNAVSITETSSITFKENLNPITDALAKISSLQAFTYDRRDGSTKNEPGLIAEEVYKIIPEIVTKDQEGKPYGIQYTKLTAFLIEAIKSLKEEIEGLKGAK